MGLKSFIQGLFMEKDVSKDKMDAALDDYIKNSQSQHQKAISTANKLLKGKLLQQQSREITQSIADLDAEREEEEEDQTFEQSIQQTIVKALMDGSMGKAVAKHKGNEPNPFGLAPEDLGPINPTAPQPKGENSPLRREAAASLDALTDVQLKKLKDQGVF